MRKRITIYADEGKVLTNGEVYGKIIHLETGSDISSYYEITDEEYEKIIAEQESEQDLVGRNLL